MVDHWAGVATDRIEVENKASVNQEVGAMAYLIQKRLMAVAKMQTTATERQMVIAASWMRYCVIVDTTSPSLGTGRPVPLISELILSKKLN